MMCCSPEPEKNDLLFEEMSTEEVAVLKMLFSEVCEFRHHPL